jgi:formate dehydrogenase subunit gamma
MVFSFNPGQKLNATFVAAAALILAGSGSIMYWNQSFSTDLRTGADFVHTDGDWWTWACYLALSARKSRSSARSVIGA